MLRWTGLISSLVTVGAGGLGLLIWATWPASPEIAEWGSEYANASLVSAESEDNLPVYQLNARAPELLAPGTVVDRSPLKGWSHLIIKSLPRLRAGEEKAFSRLVRSETVRMASWMFTAFTADVVADPVDRRFRLRAVGLGLGTAIDGHDTIVTTATVRRFGANTGAFGNEILTKAYKVQAKAIMPIGGPSLGLLDTPIWFYCTDGSRLVRYRYALLVEPLSGRLDVLMWSLGAQGAECSRLTEIVRIATNTIDPAELIVDRKKVNVLGIPGDDAFAVDQLPPGRRMAFPAALRALAAHTRFTQADARQLESDLRGLLVD